MCTLMQHFEEIGLTTNKQTSKLTPQVIRLDGRVRKYRHRQFKIIVVN